MLIEVQKKGVSKTQTSKTQTSDPEGLSFRDIPQKNGANVNGNLIIPSRLCKGIQLCHVNFDINLKV